MEWHNNQAHPRPLLLPVAAASAQPPQQPLSYSSPPRQQISFPSPMQEIRPNPPAAGAHINPWNLSSILGGSYGQPTNFLGIAGWVSSNVGLEGLGRPPNGVISSDRMAGNITAQNQGSVGMAASMTTDHLEVNTSTGLRRSWPVYEQNQDNVQSKMQKCYLHSQDPVQSKRRKAQSCSCTKTKCLTGGYCGDACGCNGCHNNSYHAVEVKASRDGILSRHSVAFRPKIMNDGIHKTASMHKMGCNCLKSQCKKKYCECYKGKVGCSPRCRCRGCLNPFGVAQESGMEERKTESGIEEREWREWLRFEEREEDEDTVYVEIDVDWDTFKNSENSGPL